MGVSQNANRVNQADCSCFKREPLQKKSCLKYYKNFKKIKDSWISTSASCDQSLSSIGLGSHCSQSSVAKTCLNHWGHWAGVIQRESERVWAWGCTCIADSREVLWRRGKEGERERENGPPSPLAFSLQHIHFPFSLTLLAVSQQWELITWDFQRRGEMRHDCKRQRKSINQYVNYIILIKIILSEINQAQKKEILHDFTSV